MASDGQSSGLVTYADRQLAAQEYGTIPPNEQAFMSVVQDLETIQKRIITVTAAIDEGFHVRPFDVAGYSVDNCGRSYRTDFRDEIWRAFKNELERLELEREQLVKELYSSVVGFDKTGSFTAQ